MVQKDIKWEENKFEENKFEEWRWVVDWDSTSHWVREKR